MRTKVLLCAAALAASLASSMAQNVYSLNIVGYYNVPVGLNQWVLIANQLNTTNNTLNALTAINFNPAGLPSGSPSENFDGSTLLKYNGGYIGYDYDGYDTQPSGVEGYWEQNGVQVPLNGATLNPGEGCFFQSRVATTLTFVGTVLEGSLTNTIPLNNVYAVRSSIVPQSGAVTSVLGVPAEDSDLCFIYNSGWTGYDYDGFDTLPNGHLGYWELNGTPNEPAPAVGSAFFYQKASGNVSNLWIRNFTVQ